MSNTVCYAVYNPTTMVIVAFVWAAVQPALTGHPELASRVIPGPPPAFNATGYGFDASFNVVASS